MPPQTKPYLIMVFPIVDGKPAPEPINATIIEATQPPMFLNREGDEFENLVAPSEFDA